jgi:hypothetical protein
MRPTRLSCAPAYLAKRALELITALVDVSRIFDGKRTELTRSIPVELRAINLTTTLEAPNEGGQFSCKDLIERHRRHV